LEVGGEADMQDSNDHVLIEDDKTIINSDSLKKVQEKRRQRKDGMSDGVVKNAVKQFSLSMTSFEEDRREQ